MLTPLILWLVFRKVDLRATAESLRSLRPGAALLVVLASFLQQVVMAWRWEVVLRRNGLSPGFAEVLRMHFISLLFQSVLPSGLGGDAARLVQVARRGRRAEGINSVLVARLAGFFVLALFVLVGSFFVEEPLGGWARFWAGVFVVGGVLGWVALRRLVPLVRWRRLGGRWGGRLERWLGNLRANMEGRGLGSLLALSVLLQVVSLLPYQAVFWAMGLRVGWGKVLTAFPLITLLVTVIPSVNGIGAREFLLWRFFAEEFGDRSVMAAYSIVFYAVFLIVLVPGVVLWLRPRQSSTSVHPSPPDAGGAAV